jgi:hypothetical protein
MTRNLAPSDKSSQMIAPEAIPDPRDSGSVAAHPPPDPDPPWTDAEDATLRRLIIQSGTKWTTFLAALPNHSSDAIWHRRTTGGCFREQHGRERRLRYGLSYWAPWCKLSPDELDFDVIGAFCSDVQGESETVTPTRNSRTDG